MASQSGRLQVGVIHMTCVYKLGIDKTKIAQNMDVATDEGNEL